MRGRLIGAVLAAAGLAAATVATGARVAAPAGADWLGFGGYDEQHYSPLDQITDRNVARLGLAWSYDIETGGASNTQPVAVGGILYFAAQYGILHAIDARTGKLLWQYDPETFKHADVQMRSSWGSRGVAYAQGKIFVGTADGRLIAVDARTGKPVWTAQTTGKRDGRYITGAPWVAGGKVLIGFGGADFAPVRGYVTAYDIATGKQAWRFYTVPGQPGVDKDWTTQFAEKSWKGDYWKWGGGGTVWNAMAYDPKRDLIFIGTGNGAPWNQKIRSPGGGDNLFLCSIVALDAKTGRYVWHYQVNPGETWDYNAAMDIELATLAIDGKPRDVILHAPKNGFFYVIDRATGKLISAEQFARTVTWASRIDVASGRPVENPAARYPDGSAFLVFPSPTGAHSAEPMAYNPRAGLVYIDAIEQGRVYNDAAGRLGDWRFKPGQIINTGTGVAPAAMTVPPITNALLAWNPLTQKEAWRLPLAGYKNGGIATTAGNLVLQGEVTGQFSIRAADTGRKLWSFDAQTGVIAAPISYMAGGRQYISVIAGWRGSGPSGLPREWDYTQQKWRVLTFVLDGKATLPPADRSERPFIADPDFRVDLAKVARGETLFGEHCSLCHGPNARSGGMAPDLRKSEIVTGIEGVVEVVHNGALGPRGMPAFPEFSLADSEALQHYIRAQARFAIRTGNAKPAGQDKVPRQD